jgi:hypothetical protein
VKNIRIQEFKNQHSRLFVASLANAGHAVNPLFVVKLFFRHSFGYVEKPLGNEAFELAERLLLEDIGDLLSLRGYTFPEDELAEFLKEGPRRIQNFPPHARGWSATSLCPLRYPR